MSTSKTAKVEKITTDKLADETMNVIVEMLDIIVSLTKQGNPDDIFIHTGNELKYFGVGHQLKISKLADTLYSTLKDVIVFVIEEMAKDSVRDFKFIVPKHTSYVGTIVKSVALDVIAHNPSYRNYIDSLIQGTGKYAFDVRQESFRNLYRDTVLALYGRGFLFEDDPELQNIQHASIIIPPNAVSSDDILPTLPQTDFDVKPSSSEEGSHIIEEVFSLKGLSRSRVILPYLRRLLESKKAATVTMKRVHQLSSRIEPDDEILQAFQEKFNEVMASSQTDMENMSDIVRGHCAFSALSYLREHFPKERVDVVEHYLNADKMPGSKGRKRYLKVPSGKRVRLGNEISENLIPMFQ